MNHPDHRVELSIVIPTLDEGTELPALFDAIAAQQGVCYEIVICDGGSKDETTELARLLASRNSIPLTTVTGAGGRGGQLNRGIASCRGEHLLFLHADSRFIDPLALKKGVETLSGRTGAAKFALCFRRAEAHAPFPYYYYEAKARLLRPECTHGDQGLIMHRDTFRRFGPFEEFPPMLAETRLAERIRKEAGLLLVPAGISTSARRFEREGLYRRQALNAILMNCANQGWDEPFRAVSDLYRNVSDAGVLQLSPILERVRGLIAGLPSAERRRFWRATGAYVRANAWQLAFLLDVRRNFRRGEAPGCGPTPTLDRFDRTIAPMLDNGPCNLAAAVLTRLWFTITLLNHRFRQ